MKLSKQAYTAEFKELAVKRVRSGQSVGAVVKELGLSDQTLRNWMKAAAEGKLNEARRCAFSYGSVGKIVGTCKCRGMMVWRRHDRSAIFPIAGMNDHLIKPFDHDQFFSALGIYFDQRSKA